jgi:uncharacterized protein (TIGR02996 family)
MLGLSIVGLPRPVPPGGLPAGVPEGYRRLMTEWGPGALCSVLELPDPTGPRFRYLQHRLRVEGAMRRASGMWGALSDDALRGGVVLGVERTGLAVLARGPEDLVVLHPNGYVLAIGAFEDLVGKFLLGGQLVKARESAFNEYTDWAWVARYGTFHEANDLGVPRHHVVADPAPRRELYAAWAAGDEATADAALAKVLAHEVTADALADLMHHLASPNAYPRDVRATYVDQLFRMARRRVPDLVPDLPIRQIRIALGEGELPAEHLASITALVRRPAGIFVDELDATEAALLEQVAEDASAEGARLVYADHLEAQGELQRAEALRAEAGGAPLAGAAERGFIAPMGFPVVDGPAIIREHLARWRAEDPGCSIDAAVAHVEALHPMARQGYELLLAMHRRRRRFPDGSAPAELLQRELRDAWPQLALALRGEDARDALAILVAARTREAAPFVLSCLRRPSEAAGMWSDRPAALADAYLQLAKVTRDLRDELAAHLTDEAPPAMRAAALRMLVGFGDDPRVFEGALRFFCEGHPFTERILRKRKTEPRVREVLGAQLAAEESRALQDGGRRLSYSPELGLLARYLAKLGDAHAQELHERYKKFKRWADYVPRERYE